MRSKARRNEKGSSVIEFALIGVPLLLLIVSLVEMSLSMWNYDTMAHVVRDAAHYASTRGVGCTYSVNGCSITVANIAQRIGKAGLGLTASQLNVALISAAGTINCNPVLNCYTNSTIWPPTSPSGTNNVGQQITVKAFYPISIIFLPFWGTVQVANPTLQASSTQEILF